MKRLKTSFYSLLALTVCLVIGVDGYGQGKTIDKTYSWQYDVNRDVSFTFNNYDCDLIIHTWDRPEVAYKLSVDATLKSEEDAARLDSYIEDLEFSHSAGSVQFDNRFWTSKKSVVGRKTMTLKGEKTIRFVEFKMKGELWIPESCIFNFRSKYSEIEVGDLNGRVDLDLYNDKFFGANVNSNLTVEAKYSSLEFKQMKDLEANLYNTDVEAGDMGNLVVVSKYSNVTVGDAKKVDINAYNDKYSFENTGDITFIDKYSDLTARNSGYIALDCYNSTVHLTTVEDIDLKSKYGKYEIGKAGTLNITTAYNDNFKVNGLGVLNVIESKYSVFKIDRLETSLLLKEGYSDKLLVSKTGAFQELKVNGKYIAVEMGVERSLRFRFNADVKYGKFDIDEEAMDVRKKIIEGPALKMEAIKGAETEGMAAFFVNGYEMAVTLTEQY